MGTGRVGNHHHVALSARISLTLSRHSSLSSIASGRSSELHLVSAESCCLYLQAVRPVLARPCEGVHRRTSLMSSFLILQQCPAFFFIRFVSVYVVHPYSSIDTTASWKKLHSILSVKSDFNMTDRLSIALHAFASRVLMSVSVDETWLPRQVKLSTSFRELQFSVEMSPVFVTKERRLYFMFTLHIFKACDWIYTYYFE